MKGAHLCKHATDFMPLTIVLFFDIWKLTNPKNQIQLP